MQVDDVGSHTTISQGYREGRCRAWCQELDAGQIMHDAGSLNG